MATILELFKNKKSDIYKNSKVYIESRGILNPPRGAALLLSSPNFIADLIGSQVSGVVKGSALRPSDTIFRNNTPFSKPIILNPLLGIKTAVESGTKYYVKPSPAPDSSFSTSLFKQGASNIPNLLLKEAKKRLPDATKKLRKELFKRKLEKEDKEDEKSPITPTDNKYEYYRPAKLIVGKSGKYKEEERNYTKYIRKEGLLQDRIVVGDKIYNKGVSRFDEINTNVQEKIFEKKDYKYSDFIKDNPSNAKQSVIIFSPYGKNYSIVLPATVSSLSEDISPEWESSKFLGSPFNVYKLNGVERLLSFDFKLYYDSAVERDVMIMKLNSIKELAFPNDEISAIKYAGESEFTQLAFAPNFVYVTIGGYINRLLGAVDKVTVNVEDTVTWHNDNNSEPHPSVINISFSMKIIENHTITTGTKTSRFNYDFNGLGNGTIGTAIDKFSNLKI